MSNEENDPEIDSVEQFEQNIQEPITPEKNPEEYHETTDKKQSTSNPRLLAVADEFTNDKTNLLVKYFHSAIKKNLMNPEKHYRLLENTNLNDNEQKCIWSNNPAEIGKIFVAFDSIKNNFKMASGNATVNNNSGNIPHPIKPYDAFATDYKTDEDGTQHFPTECLKFNNRNYWYSDADIDTLEGKTRLISFRFKAIQPVKYLCVNFHEPDRNQQVFDLIYETDQYDPRTGNPKAVLAFANIESLKTDGLQIIEFQEPILTKGISLRFKTIGAINYVFVLDKELSDEQLNMFLDINSNSDVDKKAFNNVNGSQ